MTLLVHRARMRPRTTESALASDTGAGAEAESPDERLLTVFLRILGALGLLGLALVAVVVATLV